MYTCGSITAPVHHKDKGVESRHFIRPTICHVEAARVLSPKYDYGVRASATGRCFLAKNLGKSLGCIHSISGCRDMKPSCSLERFFNMYYY